MDHVQALVTPALMQPTDPIHHRSYTDASSPLQGRKIELSAGFSAVFRDRHFTAVSGLVGVLCWQLSQVCPQMGLGQLGGRHGHNRNKKGGERAWLSGTAAAHPEWETGS